MKALVVTFSGVDGSGKTTQIRYLRRELAGLGYEVDYLWTRGGYTPGLETVKRGIRRLLGSSLPPQGDNPRRARAFRKPWVRRLWLLAGIFDLFLCYGVLVRWWKWRGKTVLCDRYVWDALVDWRVNFPEEAVDRWLLWRMLERFSPRPDAAFLLVVPVEESIRRSEEKNEPFREPPAAQERRLTEYGLLATTGRMRVLDGLRSVEELQREIMDVLFATRRPARPL